MANCRHFSSLTTEGHTKKAILPPEKQRDFFFTMTKMMTRAQRRSQALVVQVPAGVQGRVSEGSIEVFTEPPATWQPPAMALVQESAAMSMAGAAESAKGQSCGGALASERKRRWSVEEAVSSGALGKRIRQYEKERISRLEVDEHDGMDGLSSGSVQEKGCVSMVEEGVQGGMACVEAAFPALEASLSSIHFSAEEAHLPEYIVLEEDGLDGGEDEGMQQQQQQQQRRRRKKSSPWRVLRHPDSTKDARELTLLPDR